MKECSGLKVLFFSFLLLLIVILLTISAFTIASMFLQNPDVILYEGIALLVTSVLIVSPLSTLLTVVGAELLVVWKQDEDDLECGNRRHNSSLIPIEPHFTTTHSDLSMTQEETNCNRPDHISLNHRFCTTSLPPLAPITSIENTTDPNGAADMKDIFVVTEHPFHLDRAYCQSLNMAATALVFVGYTLIGLSFSIGVLFAVINIGHFPISTNQELRVIQVCLGIFCPVLLMAGFTLLGIVLGYATAGQVDCRILISYLLPTVKMVLTTTVSKPRKNLQYWAFSNGGCIRIKEPCGNKSQLRYYFDRTPATWILMVIVYFSVLVSTIFFVLYGLTKSETSKLTVADCDKYDWICLGGVTLYHEQISCVNASYLMDENAVRCYRFRQLVELDDTWSELAGAVSIYIITTYIIPVIIHGILFLQKLKRTKVWSLPFLIFGGLGVIIGVICINIFRFSPASMIHFTLASFCMLAIGALVVFSNIDIMIYAPDVRRSIIVGIDYKNTYALEEKLQSKEMTED